MPVSIFTDKTTEPTDEQLLTAFGDNRLLWQDLVDHLSDKYGEIKKEWKHYGKNYGWQLKTFLKKRNLFFTNPQQGYFRIAFVFGDKAVAVVEKSDLPEKIINELVNARKYAEGRGISFDINSQDDVEIVKKLVDIKVNN
jgi:hypothetical protein